MQIKYFDAHCHVQFGVFDADREELIERMQERGVAGIVVGVDFESSEQAVELAERYEHLFASIGLHPNREPDERFDAAEYRMLATHPKVVAIGECGLDYFRPAVVDNEVKRKQQTLLKDQIALATELDKPLIIHSRPSKKTPSSAKATEGKQDAYEDLIEILKDAKVAYPNLRGDIHFFVGGVPEMQELVALGFTVSYTAVITFARDYDDVIRAVPPGALLSETDAPYVSPASRPRGSRNDPLAVEDVVAKLAEIRGEDIEAFRGIILANARHLFRV
ncbi:MAG: TatD family hydrolase [bacterium]|nr:TatD family hydrolase [bacterium]